MVGKVKINYLRTLDCLLCDLCSRLLPIRLRRSAVFSLELPLQSDCGNHHFHVFGINLSRVIMAGSRSTHT